MKSNNRQKQAPGDSSSGVSLLEKGETFLRITEYSYPHNKNNQNEKKLDAVLLTNTAQDFKDQCEKLASILNEVKVSDNRMCRLLKNAVWEEDMMVKEPIIFEGTTGDFVKLIAPLVMSRKWKIDDTHEVARFVQTLTSVIYIRYDKNKEFLKPESLISSLQKYISEIDLE